MMSPLTELVAKETASQTTKSFLSRTEAFWGRTIDSILEKSRDGVQKYLDQQQQKFFWTKTFLHRDPIYFYDIYFPLKFLHKEEVCSAKLYTDVFKVGPRIAFIGAAGSGKSTLMRHTFLNVIQKGEYEIPLFIELRRVTPKQPLLSYIENHALGGQLILTKTGLQRLFEEGKVILFLDGFDEIAPECFADVVAAIDDIVSQFPKVKILATGRPGSRVELLRGFECARIMQLDSVDIKHFIRRQCLDAETEGRLLTVVAKLSRSQREYLSGYLSNPLLLSLFILTYNTTKQLPETKSAFYRRVVDTLFVEHDSVSKPDFDRKMRSGFSQVKFEKLLQRFSAVSFFQSKYDWDRAYITQTFSSLFEKCPELRGDESLIIRDLIVGVGLWINDDSIYSFSHRSLQEFFAASFIAALETEKKHEIYLRLKGRLCEGKTTVAQNFLCLCKELDEQSYLRFFLIPVVEEFVTNYESVTEAEAFATIIKKTISKIVLFADTAASYRRRTSRSRGPSLFGRLGWQFVSASDLNPMTQIYPEALRNLVFHFVYEGAAERLIRSRESVEMQRADLVLDLEKNFSTQEIGTAIGSTRTQRIALGQLLEFAKSELTKARLRLNELEFADATLITDLI